MKSKSSWIFGMTMVGAAALFAACGGGGGGSPVTAPEHIVFERGDNYDPDLYVVREDGTGLAAIQTGTGSKYFVGTAGDRLIYQYRPAGSSNDGIYSVKADGTGRVTLADTTLWQNVAKITADGVVIFDRGGDIYSIKADGTGLVPLATTSAFEAFHTVLPDGRVVYFYSNNLVPEIKIVNADGSGTLLLAGADVDTFTTFNGITTGNRIVYTREKYSYPYVRSLYVVNSDGTNLVSLTPASVQDFFQAVAPDGRILYSRWPDVNGVSGAPNLYSVKPDGTGVIQLASYSSGNVVIDSVGSSNRIVYTLRTGTTLNLYDLYAVNTDGKDSVKIAADPTQNEYFITFDTEGRVIYGMNTSVFDSDLYIVNSDGTGTIGLETDPVVDATLHGVAPDGRIIYSEDYSKLVSMNPDGTGRIVLDENFDEFGGFTREGRIFYSRSVLIDPVNEIYENNIFVVNTDGSGRRQVTSVGDVEALRGIF